LLAPVVVYIMASDWAFEPMRDGVLIGAYPIAYLALAIVFAALLLRGAAAHEKLPDFEDVNLAGLLRIAIFILASVGLTFGHENYGFVMLCSVFVAIVSWFCGQRWLPGIALYSIGVALALFAVFNLLGFDLSIAFGFKVGS